MSIKIYKMDPSPPCRAVYMVAELLKLKYETQDVNTTAGEHMKPEFLEKNPLHAVPVLEDRDFILADSHVIITYLVSKYGADKRGELYPSDLAIRATIDQRLYFDATVLFPVCKEIVIAILYEKAAGPTEKQIATANAGYAVLEKYLEKSKFAACNNLTLADVSLVAIICSLAVLVPLDAKYEKVRAWWKNLEEEEWYQKANVPGLTQFTGFLKMTMEKNNA